jgi:hypothetical protein
MGSRFRQGISRIWVQFIFLRNPFQASEKMVHYEGDELLIERRRGDGRQDTQRELAKTKSGNQ